MLLHFCFYGADGQFCTRPVLYPNAIHGFAFVNGILQLKPGISGSENQNGIRMIKVGYYLFDKMMHRIVLFALDLFLPRKGGAKESGFGSRLPSKSFHEWNMRLNLDIIFLAIWSDFDDGSLFFIYPNTISILLLWFLLIRI